MTKNKFTNPCIRCGKERFVTKTHKEYVGNSLVISTKTSCPDPECQKKVDAQLTREKEKREENLLQKTQHFYKAAR